MRLLITAFGPFGGRPLNASSLVLENLKSLLPKTYTRTLPVDSVRAPSILRKAIIHIKPDALLMLGEAGDASSIRLETTAWNEKTFRIPDIAGRQPIGIPIEPGAPPFLTSTLPLQRIHNQLSQLNIPVSFSDDPGRYLCNQIFFTTLHFLKSQSINIPAGFIHLPLESSLPTQDAITAIISTIDIL